MDDLSICLATIQDRDFVFQVVNSDRVRAMSFNSQEISYDVHCKWFDQMLSSDGFFFIGMVDNIRVGYVRFEWQAFVNAHVLTVAIADAWRGKKIGIKLVNMCCSEVFKYKVNKIVAFVKSENLSSVRLFERCGFQCNGNISHKGYSVVHFSKCNGVQDKS